MAANICIIILLLYSCAFNYANAFNIYNQEDELGLANKVKIVFGDFFYEIHSVILTVNNDDIQRNLFFEIILKQLSMDNIPVYNNIHPLDANKKIVLPKRVYSDYGLIIAMFEEDVLRFDVIKNKLKKLLRPRIALFIHSKDILKCSSSKILLQAYKKYFKAIWETFFVSNIIIILPEICSKPVILLYDPFCQYDVGCDNEVRILDSNDTYNLVRTKRSTFNGYPFKVALFERNPSSFLDIRSTTPEHFLNEARHVKMYLGIDAFALANLIKHLKFDLVLKDDYERGSYGFGYTNGTLTGILKDLASYKLDAGFNGRFIKFYGTNAFEFTDVSYFDEFCIIVPKSEIQPIILMVAKSIKIEVFLIVVVIGIVVASLMTLIRWIDPSKHNVKNKNSLPFAIFAAESVLSLFISVPPFKSSLTKERILIAVCLILNIIWVGTIQGTMNTSFSTISYYSDINTLEEFDQSGLWIETSSTSTEIFDADTSEVQRRLITKVVKLGESGIERAAKYRNIAGMERKTDAFIILKTLYITDDGHHMLHIVSECPRNYFLSYVVSRGSPFLPAINDYLDRIIEAGLTGWWQSYVEFYLTIKATPEETSKSRNLASLNLQEFSLSLYALLAGVTLSCFVFAAEICTLKRSKLRKMFRRKKLSH